MNYDEVTNSLIKNFDSMWQVVANFAPRFFSAIVLLLVGYFIAKFISKIIKIALDKADINRLSEKVGLAQLLVSWKMSPDLSSFISRLCFTFIFLIFLISTADVFELGGLSSTIDKFLQYLPNIVGALFIFFIASIAAHFAREALRKAGESMRLDFTTTLSNVLYSAILLIGMVLAIGQLKIETEFLTRVIEIILISAGVAMALSLGIGSRDVSKNLISGIYLKDSLIEGNFVKVGDFEGELVAVKPVCFVIKMDSGQLITLPNSRLLECEIIQK